MGGIGSYIGAKLAMNYKKEKRTDIIFICRGKTKENILNRGLLLTSKNETNKIQPDLISNNPEEIGKLDILLVATKSFSLVNAIKQYHNCLNPETIIILLLNGVNAKNEISENIKHESSKILEGSIYVASNIEKPGTVIHVGGPGKIYFGNNDKTDYKWVENILNKGGLDASYTKDIRRLLWKKYLFVSPLAAMTSALGITFGELADNLQHRKLLENMMKEVQALAKKFNVILTDQDVLDSLAILSNFPYESKSSLQLDIENCNDKTEKQNLVDFVIENGDKFEVNVDNYKEMNKKIPAA